VNARIEKQAQLKDAQDATKHAEAETTRLTAELAAEGEELEPRLFFAPKLPACVLLPIVGQLRKRIGERAACVCACLESAWSGGARW